MTVPEEGYKVKNNTGQVFLSDSLHSQICENARENSPGSQLNSF